MMSDCQHGLPLWQRIEARQEQDAKEDGAWRLSEDPSTLLFSIGKINIFIKLFELMNQQRLAAKTPKNCKVVPSSGPLNPKSCCKTYFSVIPNEVEDLELVEKTRFFAPLRMTRSRD
jgi:hypothetical protein